MMGGGGADVRILVVDDERGLLTALRKGLQAEGFVVDTASDGTDGLWMARENPYDAIVLDIMLPGINGYKICTTLREDGVWTPILMLTAKDGDLDEADALDSGADDFLSKPFSYAVLLARLRSLLRRDLGERPVALRVGELELDPGRHRCKRGADPVLLTAREFSLLEYMMRRAGNVTSKTQILEHVWGDDFEGDPNIVEVYIKHLRDKIDRPFDGNYIQTIRGVGYMLDADPGERG